MIPEDKPVEADGTQTQEAATSASMREDKEGFEVLKGSSPADMSLVHNILVRKAPVSYSEASSPSNKATHQFGSSLSQAMEVSSDLVSVRRQKEEDDWHPALRRWDFEDDDQAIQVRSHVHRPRVGSDALNIRDILVEWAAAWRLNLRTTDDQQDGEGQGPSVARARVDQAPPRHFTKTAF